MRQHRDVGQTLRRRTHFRPVWRGLPPSFPALGQDTAPTRLAEAGQPDWVIQAQIGHVSPAMMKACSYIRRQALDAAAGVLQPTSTSQSDDLDEEVREIVKEVGSLGWTRTSNPPVNSCGEVKSINCDHVTPSCF